MLMLAEAGATARHNNKHLWLWVPAFAGTTTSALTAIIPIKGIHLDRAARARDAGADLTVGHFLVIAKEHIAVIDLAVNSYDVDGTDAAFAALAVRHHLKAGIVERSEHRFVFGDHDLMTGMIDPDPKWLCRQETTRAEGLVSQIAQRAPGSHPPAPRRFQQPHRAA